MPTSRIGCNPSGDKERISILVDFLFEGRLILNKKKKDFYIYPKIKLISEGEVKFPTIE